MKLSEAIEGYLIDKRAEGYSPNTLRLYNEILPKFCAHLGDPPLEQITLVDLQKFMIWLQEDCTTRNGRPLSRARVDTFWKAIRSLFRFCDDALELPRPDLKLKRPEKPDPLVLPFSQKEFQLLLRACDFSTERHPSNRAAYVAGRPTKQRNRALLYFMVDTGLRIGEICRLEIRDVNQQTGEISVAPFGAGKKSRARTVYLGKNARRELWLYLSRKEYRDDDLLFGLTPDGVRSLFRRLSQASGVENVHPHRFRHTFAIQYLRNGGDVFTLQALLGHKDLKIVQNYLKIAQADVENAHRRASPGDNWK